MFVSGTFNPTGEQVSVGGNRSQIPQPVVWNWFRTCARAAWTFRYGM
jgi:hypothetical protein